MDKKQINFYNKNQLSAEESTLLYLIHKDKTDEEINELFNQYIKNNKGKYDYQQIIATLVKRGLLLNYNKKDELHLHRLKVSDAFVDLLFVNDDEAFVEVQKVYPSRMTIKESRDSATKYYPSFGNPISDAILYKNFIEGRKDKHIEFLYITEEYIKLNGGIAPYKFENYLNNFTSIKKMVEEFAGENKDSTDYQML